MRVSKKFLAVSLVLCLAVCGTLGYIGYNNSKPNHKIASTASKDVNDYLVAYSDKVSIDTAVMADGSSTDAGEVHALSKEDIAQLSDTVYTTIQTTYEKESVSDEMLDYLKAQIYQSVYTQLYDKASADVINNVYENIIAICLDDLYAYSDMKDDVLKIALEGALSDLSDNLLGVSDRVASAEKDYTTLDLMLGEYQAETESDMEAMLAFYKALQASMDTASLQISTNKASVEALEVSSKDTADRLNNMITSDLSNGNDNQALSASAGKTLLETMNAYYQVNTNNLDNLSANVNERTTLIDQELVELKVSTSQTSTDVDSLKVNADELRSELEKLIANLNNADDSTINNTINNINNQLTQLLIGQNKDVNDAIDYLQGLLNTADAESSVLIQKLILELSKVQSKNDTNLVDLLTFINKAQTAVSEAEFQSAIQSIKSYVGNLQVSNPDVFNIISQYLDAIYEGDVSALNKVYQILSNTLIEHNASLGDTLTNIINMINDSGYKDNATFAEILNRIKALQSADTTSMQASIYASLNSLYNALGSSTETLYAAVNASITELSKITQNVSNNLTAVENKFSDELAYTYYLLSNDLKLSNAELTNDIYAKYLELVEADTVYNNALLDELNAVNESLLAEAGKAREDLNADLVALGQALSAADTAQLEALRQADEEAYNNLIERLTNLSTELTEADSRNLQALEKANSDSYSSLLGQLNAVNDTLTNMSEENLETLRNENETAYNALTSALDILRQDKDANVQELQSALTTLNSELSDSQNDAYADLLGKLTSAEKSLSDANKATDDALRADLTQLSNDLTQVNADTFNALTSQINTVNNSLAAANSELELNLKSQLSALSTNLTNADALNREELLNQLLNTKTALESANNDSYNSLISKLGDLHTELSNAQNEDFENLIGQLGDLESTLTANASADKTEVLSTIESVKAQLEADDATNNAELINKLTTLQSDLESADASNMSSIISQITSVKSELTDSQNEDFENLVGQLGDLEATLSADANANKAEVLNTIDKVKAQLESENAESNAELINKLTNLQSDLETADASNMSNLVSQITDAKSELTRVNEQSYADLVSLLTTTETSLKDTVAADKAELQDALTLAREQLEASDASNKEELISKLDKLDTDLKAADAGNKVALEATIASVKETLEASDASNKSEILDSLNTLSTELKDADISNKQVLENSISTLRTELESSDAANKTELLNSLDSLSTELKDADITNKRALESSIATLKSDLESSDAANKTELINSINSVDDALSAEITSQVAKLVKADSDNLASLTSADATLRTDLLALAELQSADKEAVDDKNDAQDSTLTSIQNKDNAQDSAISSIQSKDSAQDSTISSIQSKDSAQDSQLSNLETAVTKAQSKADQAFQFASDGKDSIANAVTGRGVTTNANMTFAELATSIESIGDKANATSGTMLQGTKAYVDGSYVDGSIVKQTAVSKTLKAGESTTIPAGYYSSASTVSVATLASQTSADATAANILSGKTAYVNGTKVTGTMTNNGAVAKSLSAGNSYTIPAGYHNGAGTVTVKSLADMTTISTNGATAAQILSGKQAYVNGTLITGTMPNNGAVTGSALNAGGSYTIPAGYHNGSGKITANSLASQTSATATAAQILSGQTAWVNGVKVTGTMPNKGAVTGSASPGSSYTIPAGYHNGSGKVSVASLSSLTSATAVAGDIKSGKTAWVNGTKITGTLATLASSDITTSLDTSKGTITITVPTSKYSNGAVTKTQDVKSQLSKDKIRVASAGLGSGTRLSTYEAVNLLPVINTRTAMVYNDTDGVFQYSEFISNPLNYYDANNTNDTVYNSDGDYVGDKYAFKVPGWGTEASKGIVTFTAYKKTDTSTTNASLAYNLKPSGKLDSSAGTDTRVTKDFTLYIPIKDLTAFKNASVVSLYLMSYDSEYKDDAKNGRSATTVADKIQYINKIKDTGTCGDTYTTTYTNTTENGYNYVYSHTYAASTTATNMSAVSADPCITLVKSPGSTYISDVLFNLTSATTNSVSFSAGSGSASSHKATVNVNESIPYISAQYVQVYSDALGFDNKPTTVTVSVPKMSTATTTQFEAYEAAIPDNGELLGYSVQTVKDSVAYNELYALPLTGTKLNYIAVNFEFVKHVEKQSYANAWRFNLNKETDQESYDSIAETYPDTFTDIGQYGPTYFYAGLAKTTKISRCDCWRDDCTICANQDTNAEKLKARGYESFKESEPVTSSYTEDGEKYSYDRWYEYFYTVAKTSEVSTPAAGSHFTSPYTCWGAYVTMYSDY